MKKQVCIWPIGCVALEKLKKTSQTPKYGFLALYVPDANQLKTASITLIG